MSPMAPATARAVAGGWCALQWRWYGTTFAVAQASELQLTCGVHHNSLL
jgi:hypothetical protein